MNLLRKGMFVLLGLGITVACSDDDDKAIDNNGGGSSSAITNVDFTLTASDDTRTGTVTPSSDGGTLYTVDFGDASTEDDSIQTSGPAVSYTYPAANADYVISVTASASGAEDVTVTKNHTVTIPDVVEAAPFAGTWSIASQAGALGVGPSQGDISWWSLDDAGVTARACYLDDTFVFGTDGSFAIGLGSDTWLETWQGAAEEGCGTPVFPHDGSATDYTFDYNESAQTITVNGVGAYVGLPKVYNGGELTSTSEANGIESITYNIVEISEDGNTMTLDIQFQPDGGYWTYVLTKSGTDNGGGNNGGGSDSALAGSWSVAAEAGAIGVGPSQGDLSWWSLDDAGVTARACYLDDTFVFGADGSFSLGLGDATWLEGWQGAAEEGCGTPVFPHDGSATDYTYTHDATAGTITVNGIGAYIGLAKVYNGGELTSTSEANGIESITYNIVDMADGRMTLDIQFQPDGGYWTYVLVKN
jgi:hypothetical protein